MIDLSSIRDPSRRIPSDRHLNVSPIDTQAYLQHPLEQEALRIAASFPSDSILALDLDDTLLSISYNVKIAWKSPQNRAFTHHSTPLTRRLFSRPTVTVQPRPGVLGAITGWKKAGLAVFIISASAKLRLEFIKSRLPFLDLPSASGEQIAAALKTLPDHPQSLAAKTPAVFQSIFNSPPYDLIIDDSIRTADLFKQLNLSNKLLSIELSLSNSSYFIDVLEAAKLRLTNPHTTSSESKVCFSNRPLINYPFLRLEDPFFYPLMNLTDNLPA